MPSYRCAADMRQDLVSGSAAFDDSFQVRDHVMEVGNGILRRKSVLDLLPGFLDIGRVGIPREIEGPVVIDLGDVLGQLPDVLALFDLAFGEIELTLTQFLDRLFEALLERCLLSTGGAGGSVWLPSPR